MTDDDGLNAVFEPHDRHLPDGVYLGLPPDWYFNQDRLGSTDMAICTHV